MKVEGFSGLLFSVCWKKKQPVFRVSFPLDLCLCFPSCFFFFGFVFLVFFFPPSDLCFGIMVDENDFKYTNLVTAGYLNNSSVSGPTLAMANKIIAFIEKHKKPQDILMEYQVADGYEFVIEYANMIIDSRLENRILSEYEKYGLSKVPPGPNQSKFFLDSNRINQIVNKGQTRGCMCYMTLCLLLLLLVVCGLMITELKNSGIDIMQEVTTCVTGKYCLFTDPTIDWGHQFRHFGQ